MLCYFKKSKNAPETQKKICAIYSEGTLVENSQCYAIRDVADILKISTSSSENHVHQLGCVNQFDVWLPHKLSEKNLLEHISTCSSLLKHNKKFHF